ncbi:MAG: type II toxin-antitoxin system RelE/ParE family toxin [Cohaesibacter sp.]|nr:type II toxin-antitoxin system RelE/ParE family toxin [Cohaesibacter sp.]
MGKYQLTDDADLDLSMILEEGISKFGLDQAVKHYDALVARMEEIAHSPKLYQAVDDIRPGYRRTVVKKHAIYYTIQPYGVLIIRILGRQGLDESFPEDMQN